MRLNLRAAIAVALAAAVLGLVACSDTDDGADATAVASAEPTTAAALATPTTPPEQTAKDIEVLMHAFNRGLSSERIARVGRSGDVRNSWYLSDLMQFFPRGQTAEELNDAWQELTGQEEYPRGWKQTTDYLIGNDIAAPDDYARLKIALIQLIGADWNPFGSDSLKWPHLGA